MPDPYSVASPHPAYQILAQFNAPRACWVFRVFGPDAAWYGTFRTVEEAVAFVRDSTEPPNATVAAELAN
jgi:hypothetical protein